ncbi:hypothetical protein [Streptomyces griseoaurantiacus]|uniref:hypothetical protein n=1 Tax=Streptomyces griseoaurantiacus TaxID=68213 RepID=UPI000594AFE6|nr:hypothetical protein [Streptomyces griseoaurantiacus]
MSTYLVTLPVDFDKEPTKDYLSELNAALASYDPRRKEGELFWTRSSDTGTHTIRLVVEADDERSAQQQAHKIANAALLDTGHTVLSARIDDRFIDARPWTA